MKEKGSNFIFLTGSKKGDEKMETRIRGSIKRDLQSLVTEGERDTHRIVGRFIVTNYSKKYGGFNIQLRANDRPDEFWCIKPSIKEVKENNIDRESLLEKAIEVLMTKDSKALRQSFDAYHNHVVFTMG